MFDKVLKTIEEYHMFDNIDRVIVALSGGADSMSLLHILNDNADYFGIKVSAAHLNHLLRGEESERDEKFAVDYCTSNGIEIFTRRANIAHIAAEKKLGLEECGRTERYRFFAELANNAHTVIATAHTASDNAETVLMNITRGSGMEGLCGIPPVRGCIVRPLLACSRADIEIYCEKNNIPFATDSTNFSQDYNRNKIRLSVIPALRQINPSVETAINRLSDTIKQNMTYFSKIIENKYAQCKTDIGLSIDKVRLCDNSIIPNILKYAIEVEFSITPEKRHIDIIRKIIEDGHGAVEIRKNMIVRVVNGSLIFENTDNSISKECEPFKDTILKIDSKISYNGKVYTFSPKCKFSPEKNYKINKMLLNKSLSCDIISCDTIVRNRRSGDVFRPLGRNCTKTVKKLFTEMKIPIKDRDRLLVAAKGNIVYWIETIGVSQDGVPENEYSEYFTVEVEGIPNV